MVSPYLSQNGTKAGPVVPLTLFLTGNSISVTLYGH